MFNIGDCIIHNRDSYGYKLYFKAARIINIKCINDLHKYKIEILDRNDGCVVQYNGLTSMLVEAGDLEYYFDENKNMKLKYLINKINT